MYIVSVLLGQLFRASAVLSGIYINDPFPGKVLAYYFNCQTKFTMLGIGNWFCQFQGPLLHGKLVIEKSFSHFSIFSVEISDVGIKVLFCEHEMVQTIYASEKS